MCSLTHVDVKKILMQVDEDGDAFLHLTARLSTAKMFKQVLNLISPFLKDLITDQGKQNRTLLHNTVLNKRTPVILHDLLKQVMKYGQAGELGMMLQYMYLLIDSNFEILATPVLSRKKICISFSVFQTLAECRIVILLLLQFKASLGINLLQAFFSNLL